MRAQRGSRGKVLLFLTLALDGGGWLIPRPGRFTPGKETRYPLYRRLGGPQFRSGRVRKISPPTGILSPDRPARSESLYRLRYLCLRLSLDRMYNFWNLNAVVRNVSKCWNKLESVAVFSTERTEIQNYRMRLCVSRCTTFAGWPFRLTFTIIHSRMIATKNGYADFCFLLFY